MAFLATTGVAGMDALPALGQTGRQMPMSSSGLDYGLNDISLAPGEVIVGSPGMSNGGAVTHNGGSYQIIDSSSVPTANMPMADPVTSEMPMMQSPNYGGYANNGYPAAGCATGNCGSSGSNYAGYSGAMLGRGGAKLGSGGNVCGPTCNPYLYASLEALYFTNRQVGNYSQSPNFFLDDFDYEFGVRGTVGIVPDCRNGMEFSFVGPFTWNTAAQLNSSTGGIGTFLVPRGTLVAGDLSNFSNAVSQRQEYEAQYYSLEANRTLIGWEICKFLYGMRYVNYEEDFLYRSATVGAAPANQGQLFSSTQNRLIGAQVGLEMTYPITCKLWSDFRGRAGAYGNFAENQFRLSNGGTLVARNFDDDVELAGLFEFGGGVRYYLTDDFHVRAGAEMWYLTGVATAIDQFSSRVRQDTGRRIDIDDDVLMMGINVGAELKF